MTLFARVAWFVLGLGMVIGAMLLTVHFSHADPIPQTPWGKQRDICINYGAQIDRHGEKQNDWLLFCMQQAHWQVCESCQADPDHNWGKHQTCAEIGTAALYQPECWRRQPFEWPRPTNMSVIPVVPKQRSWVWGRM